MILMVLMPLILPAARLILLQLGQWFSFHRARWCSSLNYRGIYYILIFISIFQSPPQLTQHKNHLIIISYLFLVVFNLINLTNTHVLVTFFPFSLIPLFSVLSLFSHYFSVFASFIFTFFFILFRIYTYSGGFKSPFYCASLCGAPHIFKYLIAHFLHARLII